MASVAKSRLSLACVLFVVPWLGACNRSGESSSAVSSASQNSTHTSTTESAPPESTATSSQPNSDLTSAFPINEAKKTEPAPAANSNIPLHVVDVDEFHAALEKHKGKVVLVDCWATWCGPCKEQFPHTVELGQKYGQQGLAVVSLSFDEPDKSSEVAAFLETQNAGFDHFITKTGMSLESFVKFDIEGGALPFYKLYDRSGKLRYQFCGDNTDLKNVLSIDELDKRLEELLAEKA